MQKTIGESWHDEAEANLKRDGIAVGAMLLVAFLLMTLMAAIINNAHADEPYSKENTMFASTPIDRVRRNLIDVYEHEKQKKHAAQTTEQLAVMSEEQARIDEEQRLAEEAAAAEYWASQYYYSEPSYSGGTQGNPDGLNSFNGTYEFNGHHETFYASSAVYDDQLHVDDEGFWRTDDGHYVVASSDYAEGTEIEISQGMAIVMDSGCEPGTVDVHTTWR